MMISLIKLKLKKALVYVVVFLQWLLAKAKGVIYSNPLFRPIPKYHKALILPMPAFSHALKIHFMGGTVWVIADGKAVYVCPMSEEEIKFDQDIEAACDKLEQEQEQLR